MKWTALAKIHSGQSGGFVFIPLDHFQSSIFG